MRIPLNKAVSKSKAGRNRLNCIISTECQPIAERINTCHSAMTSQSISFRNLVVAKAPACSAEFALGLHGLALSNCSEVYQLYIFLLFFFTTVFLLHGLLQ